MKDDYTTNFHNLTTFDFKGDGRTYFLSLGVKADSVAETPLENQSSVSVRPGFLELRVFVTSTSPKRCHATQQWRELTPASWLGPRLHDPDILHAIDV